MVKLPKFKVTLSEPKVKNGFTRVYPNIECFDEKTAKQWAEKQRDVWTKAYDVDADCADDVQVNPRDWTITVEEIKEEPKAPEKKEDKNAEKKAEKLAAKNNKPKGKKARKAEKEAALVAAVSKK